MRPAGATLRLFAQWLRPTTICGGTDFLCPPFSCPESPVFAGFRVFPCGRSRARFSDFWPQSPNFSLFSLLPCGRVHELDTVFMRVPAIGLDYVSGQA